jgi:N-terminal domain of cytochrome oxidase-cbb3, FixP
MAEDLDNLEAFEAKETSRKLPIGWIILFWGLIAWGVYYFAAYTPAISGWSQEKAYEAALKK